jgi:hypothetical protein
MSHSVHWTYYEASQPKSQGYYVLWTECDIMAAWAGRRCGLPFATSAGTLGYRKRRTRRIVRVKSAGQPYGTKVALMGGHEKRESRQVGAAKRQQRSTDDAIMPRGHNMWRFLVMGRKALSAASRTRPWLLSGWGCRGRRLSMWNLVSLRQEPVLALFRCR